MHESKTWEAFKAELPKDKRGTNPKRHTVTKQKNQENYDHISVHKSMCMLTCKTCCKGRMSATQQKEKRNKKF